MKGDAGVVANRDSQTGMFRWCLHCERTYRWDRYRVDENGLRACPYPDCDGTVFADGWPWSEFRKGNRGYPMVP